MSKIFIVPFCVQMQSCCNTRVCVLLLLIWIGSISSGSTFTKIQPKSKVSTFVSDEQIPDFNIVNSSLFTKLVPNHDDFVFTESRSFAQDDARTEDGGAKPKLDNTSVLNDKFLNPQILFHEENKPNQNINSEYDKQNNFKTKGIVLKSNETVDGLKIESKDALNLTLTNHTRLDSQNEFGNASFNLGIKRPTKDNLLANKSVSEDKLLKTNLSDTALFNKYLISERKKAASQYNSTHVNKHKQKIFYPDSTTSNEPALMNDQPVQMNVSDEKLELSIKSSSEDENDKIELGDRNSTSVMDSSSNDTIYNDSSSAISHIMSPDQSDISFSTIVITGVSLGVIIVGGIMAAGSYVFYRHRYWNKPQTLSDKCSNADSSGYIDDSTLRENSEEMYSLDNDSFLNSLEAMTIQNYWTDNVKHTKL